MSYILLFVVLLASGEIVTHSAPYPDLEECREAMNQRGFASNVSSDVEKWSGACMVVPFEAKKST